MWFEYQMDIGGSAFEARRAIFEQQTVRLYATIEEVPAYRLKTPLQQAVQLLKRHRDQRFRNDPENKPASIILTTLAARAYSGEKDIVAALFGILAKMEGFIRPTKPRIENPVDPGEDFADRWDENSERYLRRWIRQAKSDFGTMVAQSLTQAQLSGHIEKSLGLAIPTATLAIITSSSTAASVHANKPAARIPDNAARPWSPTG